MSAKKNHRRHQALFNSGGSRVTPERSAEFYRNYPECPRPEPLDRLALPLKRKFAEEIVAGTKTVEFRECKPHYGNRIFDKEVMRWRDLHADDSHISDDEFACADTIRQVRTIHFYDYNGTWSLDVSIKETGIIALTEEDINYLHTAFNCHEMDYALPELAAAGILAEERPLLFYFAIDKILSSNL